MSPKPGKPEENETAEKPKKPKRAAEPPPQPVGLPAEVYDHLREARKHLERAQRSLPSDQRRARAMVGTALDALASRHLKGPR